MKINKKIIKSKKIKLLILGLCAFSLLSTSGYSFAKYYSENNFDDNATIAEFGSWKVEYSTTPVNMPDDAPKGYYAYLANFKVSFTKGEVKRKYTLKIKTAKLDVDSSSFESAATYSNADFYYPSTTTIYTTVKNSSNEIEATSSNVASTLTDNKINSFTPNTIYISNSEGISFTEAEKVTNWNILSLDDIYDPTTDSLEIHSEHPIGASEEDYHVYKIVFFYNYTNFNDIEDFKFIYRLNVEQEV